jgi:hypothetical protein
LLHGGVRSHPRDSLTAVSGYISIEIKSLRTEPSWAEIRLFLAYFQENSVFMDLNPEMHRGSEQEAIERHINLNPLLSSEGDFMGRNYFWIAVIFIAIFAPAAYAADIDSCSCDLIHGQVEVKNSGSAVSPYHMTLSGSASNWASITDTDLLLLPGESKMVDYFLNPGCGVSGWYGLDFIIQHDGQTETQSQGFNLMKCPQFQVSFADITKTGCRCSQFIYEFSITNKGDVANTFNFEMEPYAQYAKVSANPIVVLPGKQVRAYVNVTPACSIGGNTSFIARIVSQNTQSKAETPILMEIMDCGLTYNTTTSTKNNILVPVIAMSTVMYFLLFILLLALLYWTGLARSFYRRVHFSEPKAVRRKQRTDFRTLFRIIGILIILIVLAVLIITYVREYPPTIYKNISTNKTANASLPAKPIANKTIPAPVNKIVSAPTNKTISSSINKTNATGNLSNIIRIDGAALSKAASWLKDVVILYYVYILLGFILLSVLIVVLNRTKRI